MSWRGQVERFDRSTRHATLDSVESHAPQLNCSKPGPPSPPSPLCTHAPHTAVQDKMMECAARFSQAAAELQYMGVIRPATRRRGDFVQRCMHMPVVA